MSTNAKTRNRSNAKSYAAAKAAKARTARQAFRETEEYAHEHAREPRHAPTSAVYRMVGTGATGHKGKEIAKLFATGAIARTQRSTDAAGPLRDNVGLTTQRGGALDYRGPGGQPDHREAARTDMRTQTTRRAAQLASYTGNRPNLPTRHTQPERKRETGSIITKTKTKTNA